MLFVFVVDCRGRGGVESTCDKKVWSWGTSLLLKFKVNTS